MLSYIRNTIFGYESLSTRITPFYYVKALYSITHFRVRNKFDPREGVTVTTLVACTPALQSISFSSLSCLASPSFFPLLVILSMVGVATQQWLSHMHMTHAHVSHTWWLTCSWLITGYESIRVSLYLVSWHYLSKGINTRFLFLSYTLLSSLPYATSCLLLCT